MKTIQTNARNEPLTIIQRIIKLIKPPEDLSIIQSDNLFTQVDDLIKTHVPVELRSCLRAKLTAARNGLIELSDELEVYSRFDGTTISSDLSVAVFKLVTDLDKNN